MGDFTAWPGGRAGAAGAAGAAAPAAAAAGAAGICIGAACIIMGWGAGPLWRLMRTDSSPSVISISAMPDSSSSSMSFLTLRMSMHVPRVRLERDSLSGLVLALRRRRDLLQAAQRR